MYSVIRATDILFGVQANRKGFIVYYEFLGVSLEIFFLLNYKFN